MKKILFCTHKQSPFFYTVPPALASLGFEVSIFDYYQPTLSIRLIGLVNNKLHFDKNYTLINKFVNTALLHQVAKEKPDYFFTTKALTITNETIEEINNLGVTTINWFQDLLQFLPWMKSHATSYRYFFTMDPLIQRELKKVGISSYFFPLGTNPDREHNRSKKEYDLVFTGQWTKRREKLFNQLDLLGDKFSIWGFPGWNQSVLKKHYHGFLPTADEVYNILRKSKIVLNVQTADKEYPTEVVNLRVFETTGVGTFLLSWYHPELEDFFKIGREIETFRTPEEALEKSRFYLTHDTEREKIAQAGWRRTVKDHSYVNRFKTMFKIVT